MKRPDTEGIPAYPNAPRMERDRNNPVCAYNLQQGGTSKMMNTACGQQLYGMIGSDKYDTCASSGAFPFPAALDMASASDVSTRAKHACTKAFSRGSTYAHRHRSIAFAAVRWIEVGWRRMRENVWDDIGLDGI